MSVVDFVYEAAPIVEAVIEIRFSSPLSNRQIELIAKKISKGYPNKKELQTRGVEVNLIAAIANFQESAPFIRLSSKDETESCTITASSLIFGQIAPYSNWIDFFGRFDRDWNNAEKILSKLDVGRVGVRFINRIDMLIGEKRGYPNDYLSIGLALPQQFDNLVHAALSVQSDYGARPLRIILNSAFVESPIPNLESMLLDIDVVEERNPPKTYQEICDLLTEMRQVKNEVFEASISPYARKRFKP